MRSPNRAVVFQEIFKASEHILHHKVKNYKVLPRKSMVDVYFHAISSDLFGIYPQVKWGERKGQSQISRA